jgi:hypothetical protein
MDLHFIYADNLKRTVLAERRFSSTKTGMGDG